MLGLPWNRQHRVDCEAYNMRLLQVGEVTGIMRQNVEKVLDRGDKLDDLVDKTDELQASVSLWVLHKRG